MNASADSLIVTDTREIADEERYLIQGSDRDLCLACDAAIPLGKLFSVFRKRGISRTQVEESIDRLKRKNLVIELDGRLLALVLWQPPKELPHGTQWPGGCVDPEKFAVLRAQHERMIERSAQRGA